MTSERPQDQWLGSAPNADALHMLPLAQKRAKSALFRVIWSGALLVLFGFSLSRRLEEAQKNDTTTTFAVITLIVLGRFGYYVYRLLAARRAVAALQQRV